MEQRAAYLERILEPIRRSFTPQFAKELSDFTLDSKLTRRMDRLASKSTEGGLSEDERSEYETYVHTLDILAFLQAQAREYLARNRR